MQSVKRSSKQSTRPGQEIWGYSSDYHIQTSWVPRGETLRDSMVAYSKRMNDIRKVRGIHVSKSYQSAESSPSLLVSTSRSAFDLLSMTEDTGRRLYNQNNRLSRSLGSIKLEPLLGSQKSTYKSELNKTVSLQIYKMRKEKAARIFSGNHNAPVSIHTMFVTDS